LPAAKSFGPAADQAKQFTAGEVAQNTKPSHFAIRKVPTSSLPTPNRLNSQGGIRWLKRDQPNVEEACRTTTRIIEDGKRATEIIDRLQSLYKKSPPQRERVEVNEIIGQMVLLLRSEASRCAVSLRTQLGTDLPKAMADRVQLQQVLMNLMLNGIEAMKETGGRLTVKSQLGEQGQLLISVSDNGIGLPDDEADQIFNSFFTTKPQGSGMGLAISRSIIEAHDGRLWATANEGRGASFHFTLPSEAVPPSPGD
jgi:signal transduction histidine kinase